MTDPIEQKPKKPRIKKPKKEIEILTGDNLPIRMQKLRHRAHFFYDLQKLRIQSGNRNKTDVVALDEEDKEFIEEKSGQLHALEADLLKELDRMMRGIPIYEQFLKRVKGIGPTLSAVLLAYIHIENCHTVSKLWAWCGLGITNGKADRRVKGEKTKYNPWLKSKMWILGECLLKSNSPYRQFYDDYKHRLDNRVTNVCMKCKGEKIWKCTGPKRTGCEGAECETCKGKKLMPCDNCDGTGGPAPYGEGKAHRHAMSLRFMVKMFLRDLYIKWRTLEGLEVRPPYEEEYLGRKHHGKPFEFSQDGTEAQ